MVLPRFLTELKRRKVYRVALVYAAVGWALLEMADVVLPRLGLPDWTVNAVLAVVLLGFPLALVFAWIFDFGPEGIVRTLPVFPEVHHRFSFVRIAEFVVICILVATVGYLYVDRLSLQERLVDPESAVREESGADQAVAPNPEQYRAIAVLPFADMSEAGDQQYFGDGIAEELLNALARVEGLKVAARTSAFGYKNLGASMEEIGTALHVNYVLEGSVRRSGDQVRITAQLVDVHSGYHLFSESYDRKLEDVFAIQDDIAREIVGALLPSLGAQLKNPLITRQTDSQEAHDLRMQARHAFFSATPGSLKAAVELLQQAVTIDPRYSGAWGDLSYAFGYLGNQAGDPLVSLTRSLEAANRALALDPDNPEGRLAKAWWLGVFQYDHEQAGQLFQGLRGGAGGGPFWAIGISWAHLFPLGRYEEALQYVREAQALDPLIKPVLAQTEMAALLALGRLPEALEVANQVYLSTAPPPPTALWASDVFSRAGELEKAATLLEYGLSRMGVAPVSITAQARLNTARGDGDANRQLLESLLARRAQGEWVFPAPIAYIYLELGEQEKAIDWLERALDMHDPMMVEAGVMTMRGTPGLLDNPRVKVIFQRMNLPLTPDATSSQTPSGTSAVIGK
jgi:TolB-like protein